MKKSRILVGMLEQVVIEKLEVAKVTKSFVLNGQRLTDVPGVVLEDEWCQQYLQSLYLKNNLIRGVVSYNHFNVHRKYSFYVTIIYDRIQE